MGTSYMARSTYNVKELSTIIIGNPMNRDIVGK